MREKKKQDENESERVVRMEQATGTISLMARGALSLAGQTHSLSYRLALTCSKCSHSSFQAQLIHLLTLRYW